MSKMIMRESVNFNATVTANDGQRDVPVMSMGASLNTEQFNININCSVLNRALYEEYAAQMQEKYAEFENVVKQRAKELGYVIFGDGVTDEE